MNCTNLTESDASTWINAQATNFSGFQNSWIKYFLVNNTLAVVGIHLANGGVKVLTQGTGFQASSAWSSNVNPFAFQIVTKEGNSYNAQFRQNPNTGVYQWFFPAVEGGAGSQDIWAYATVPYGNKQP